MNADVKRFGFIPCKKTTDALFCFEKNRLGEKVVCMCFVDIKKAVSAVPRKVMD